MSEQAKDPAAGLSTWAQRNVAPRTFDAAEEAARISDLLTKTVEDHLRPDPARGGGEVNKERYHRALAKAVAEACEKVACRPEPLLADPGELVIGWVWAGPTNLPVRQLATAVNAMGSPEQVAWLRQARAVMDLLASPEPPEDLCRAMVEADASWGDWIEQAEAAWAWLRRQAGLEGGGE